VKGVTVMARPRRLGVDYLVYWVVRGGVGLGQVLTIEQAYAVARLLARLLYVIDARHRDVGLDNVKQAFGDRYTDAERDRIVRGVYEHFCGMLMEVLHTPRMLHLTNWRDRITLVGQDKVLNVLMGGGPVIFLSGHFGNWEMAGYLFGLFGYPMNSVARALDNPYLDRLFRRFRERSGQTLIPKSGGHDQMVEMLRGGGAPLSRV